MEYEKIKNSSTLIYFNSVMYYDKFVLNNNYARNMLIHEIEYNYKKTPLITHFSKRITIHSHLCTRK